MKSCWEALAQAIILKAVEDYRLAQRRKLIPDQRRAALATIREVERFLCSKWFAQLTKLDGKALLNQLKEEMVA